MEELFAIIGELNSIAKLAWVFICLTFFWILEAVIPLFSFDYNKLKHIGFNMIFFAMMLIINVLFGLVIVAIFPLLQEYNIGIFNWVDLPFWVAFPIKNSTFTGIQHWNF